MLRGPAVLEGAWHYLENPGSLSGAEASWTPLGVSWDVLWWPIGGLLERLGDLLAAFGGLLGRLECL